MKYRYYILPILLFAAITDVYSQNRENWKDSLKVINYELNYHPDSLNLHLKKAAVNIQLDQWNYAMDEYNIVLGKQPYNPAALFYRAFVNERLHKYNFARADYETLLQIVPGNFEVRLGLALLNQKDRHLTEALDGINRLVTAHPDSAIAWAARAGIEDEQGMLVPAEYDYSEAIRRDPHNADYLLSRADIRIRLKEFGKARQDLDAITRLGTPKPALKEWYDRCK